ncbi:MAG: S-layer homology domain-containing protein [Chloroflexia bacterium]
MVRDAPVRVTGTGTGGLVFVAIDAGGFHSLGLAANGTAYGWGRNDTGQVGNGTSGSGVVQTTPAAVSGTGPGGVALTAIVGGTVHSLASGDASDPYCAGFVDLPANDPACPAVAVLTQQGTIRGYAGVPPRFGPTDNVQRAQVAAFLVRALAWQAHPTGPRTFTDLAGLATELRNSSLIVANTCDSNGLCVAYGYGDGRFGPTDPVSHAQVITFITRAFRLDPVQAWVPQPGDPQPYTGVPAVHDTDVRTFVHYAGPIPGAPSTAAGWNAPASRAWVAQLLYQALTVQP